MQVTLKDKKGHEDYSLGLKLPNKGTGCFTFEAVQTQGKPEIRIVFNSKATDSRDSTAPVISLVIRSKASNSQTTLSFKNPGKPQASIPFEGPEDCFLSHSPKSFWISIQNICHHVNAAVDQVDNTLVLFGAGNQPGKYIRLVVAVDSSVSLPEYVGISNWEGTTLLSNYLVSDPPKLGFTTCRLINQNPKNGAQLPCPTITLEPQFTILKAYDTLCDNTLSTCMWSHAIRFRDELAFCIIGPHKEQCKASFNWKGASNLALVASTNTKSINIRIPLDKGKGIITLIQKGIPLAEASRRHPEATDIFTILKKDAIQLRIEHFSNGRIAPHYSGISPDVLAKQALSALHLMVATREILLDSKWNELLQHKEGKDAFFSLMGFEATNPLHGDFPGHWHIATRKTKNPNVTPHIYFDPDGISTSLRPLTQQRKSRTEIPGICEINLEGNAVVFLANAKEQYRLIQDVLVVPMVVKIFKASVHWCTVKCSDDTSQGSMTFNIKYQNGTCKREHYDYDPLCGGLNS